jgi:hypothetical protein
MTQKSRSLVKAWNAMEEERGIRVKRLYVEKLPSGEYAVRTSNSLQVRAIAPTQAEAIARAKQLYPGSSPDIERVRTTSRGTVDRWRKA